MRKIEPLHQLLNDHLAFIRHPLTGLGIGNCCSGSMIIVFPKAVPHRSALICQIENILEGRATLNCRNILFGGQRHILYSSHNLVGADKHGIQQFHECLGIGSHFIRLEQVSGMIE